MKLMKIMKSRSLLKLQDLSEEELMHLLDLAAWLKERRRRGIRGYLLLRKHIAMIFEKASTRTRCAVSVAVADEGGHAEYLSAGEIHLGKKESVADTARVLGRMFDGILFRGYKQETVNILVEHSGIPVWNGLTDEHHPTQALADLMTIRETFGRLNGLKVVFMGDGRNNVATSLMTGCAKCGMVFINCCPPELAPSEENLRIAYDSARKTGGSVTVMCDPSEAVKGANVIYTDVWVSMGEEDKMDERRRQLKPYQVTMDLVRRTGNMEKGRVIFMHCLPAFHDSQTEVTREIGAMEVTDEVFQGPLSRVFDEAENRVHTMKALMVSTLT